MISESTKNRYSSAHATYSIQYHIVFCPKYRRPVLEPLREELMALFSQVAEEMEICIISMEVMSDHVHLFVTSKPSYEPQLIVDRMKGYTSRVLRARHEWLRKRLPTLWTRSYYIASVGNASAKTISKYIENQKGI